MAHVIDGEAYKQATASYEIDASLADAIRAYIGALLARCDVVCSWCGMHRDSEPIILHAGPDNIFICSGCVSAAKELQDEKVNSILAAKDAEIARLSDTLSCVADRASRGRISKSNYDKKVYYEQIDEAFECERKEALDEEIERLKKNSDWYERLLAESTLYFDMKDDDAKDFHARLCDLGLQYAAWAKRKPVTATEDRKEGV